MLVLELVFYTVSQTQRAIRSLSVSALGYCKFSGTLDRSNFIKGPVMLLDLVIQNEHLCVLEAVTELKLTPWPLQNELLPACILSDSFKARLLEWWVPWFVMSCCYYYYYYEVQMKWLMRAAEQMCRVSGSLRTPVNADCSVYLCPCVHPRPLQLQVLYARVSSKFCSLGPI